MKQAKKKPLAKKMSFFLSEPEETQPGRQARTCRLISTQKYNPTLFPPEPAPTVLAKK